MRRQRQIIIVENICNGIRDELIDKIQKERIPEYWDEPQFEKYLKRIFHSKKIELSSSSERQYFYDVRKNKL